jgi:hypothetical protein
MPANSRVSGSYKNISKISVRVGGAWKDVSKGSVRVSGVWKDFFSPSAAGAFELIETVNLTSTQTDLTFSNLGTYNTTYKHLQIRGTVRSNRGDDNSNLGLRFNADTGSNYTYHTLQTLSGSFDFARGTNQTSITFGYTVAGNTTNSNHFGAYVIDLLDVYNTNKFKTTRAFSGQPSGRNFISLASGVWRSTSSVTSITLLDLNGSMVSGTRWSLYGIKGA